VENLQTAFEGGWS